MYGKLFLKFLISLFILVAFFPFFIREKPNIKKLNVARLYEISPKKKNQKLHFASECKEIEKICIKNYMRCEKVKISQDFPCKMQAEILSGFIRELNFVNKFFPSLSNKLGLVKLTVGKKRKAYSSRTVIFLKIPKNFSVKQIWEVFSHELGHIVDLTVLTGKIPLTSRNFTEFGRAVFSLDDKSLKFYRISRKSENQKKPSSTILDFVSGYGLTNPFEDFAESFNMYIFHNELFKKMAMESKSLQKKFKFFYNLFSGQYLESYDTNKFRPNFRPWDSTNF